MQQKAVFHVGAEIQEQHRDAYRALRRLAGMPHSKIQLVACDGTAASAGTEVALPASGGGSAVTPASGGSVVAPASGGSVVASASGEGDHVVRLNTMRQVFVWACAARRVENLTGPKVVAVDGVPLAA